MVQPAAVARSSERASIAILQNARAAGTAPHVGVRPEAPADVAIGHRDLLRGRIVGQPPDQGVRPSPGGGRQRDLVSFAIVTRISVNDHDLSPARGGAVAAAGASAAEPEKWCGYVTSAAVDAEGDGGDAFASARSDDVAFAAVAAATGSRRF
jgi:hypothetical protein